MTQLALPMPESGSLVVEHPRPGRIVHACRVAAPVVEAEEFTVPVGRVYGRAWRVALAAEAK